MSHAGRDSRSWQVLPSIITHARTRAPIGLRSHCSDPLGSLSHGPWLGGSFVLPGIAAQGSLGYPHTSSPQYPQPPSSADRHGYGEAPRRLTFESFVPSEDSQKRASALYAAQPLPPRLQTQHQPPRSPADPMNLLARWSGSPPRRMSWRQHQNTQPQPEQTASREADLGAQGRQQVSSPAGLHHSRGRRVQDEARDFLSQVNDLICQARRQLSQRQQVETREWNDDKALAAQAEAVAQEATALAAELQPGRRSIEAERVSGTQKLPVEDDDTAVQHRNTGSWGDEMTDEMRRVFRTPSSSSGSSDEAVFNNMRPQHGGAADPPHGPGETVSSPSLFASPFPTHGRSPGITDVGPLVVTTSPPASGHAAHHSEEVAPVCTGGGSPDHPQPARTVSRSDEVRGTFDERTIWVGNLPESLAFYDSKVKAMFGKNVSRSFYSHGAACAPLVLALIVSSILQESLGRSALRRHITTENTNDTIRSHRPHTGRWLLLQTGTQLRKHYALTCVRGRAANRVVCSSVQKLCTRCRGRVTHGLLTSQVQLNDGGMTTRLVVQPLRQSQTSELLADGRIQQYTQQHRFEVSFILSIDLGMSQQP